jgi:LytS/YehU family sensor histidine kinase
MKQGILPTKIQLVISAVLWFGISVAFQALLVHKVAGAISPVDVVVTSCLLIVAVFFIYILQRYSSNYFNNLLTRVGILGILVFKIVWVQKILLLRMVTLPGYSEVIESTLIIRVFAAFLVVSFFSFISWLIFYLKRTEEQDRIKSSVESSLRDAELMKLRQQVQPHFLFNSLNSINALVGSEPMQARKMIQNLSDFLRGTLKSDENKPVSLNEEINLLKLYLDIEEVRFGHRMRVIFNVSNDALGTKLPPLLLQPIVENAIKFGLYNVLEEVEIRIIAEEKSNLLEITVTNPFDERTAVTRKGEGFGLSLIQRRLQLIYHRADLLKIERANGVFTTQILIPQP